MDFVPPFIIAWGQPLLITTIFTVIGYWLLGKSFTNQPNNRLFRQLAYVVLFSVAILLLVALLPINAETKEFIFQIATYALPAVIALSSTTLVANAMAGLSLKMMQTFRTGAARFGSCCCRQPRPPNWRTPLCESWRSAITRYATKSPDC